MNTYFSIGEIAKLHRVSIQTLRHYDKIGLLIPNYINQENNYRYYTIEQFIKLEFIKQYKMIGFSLDEIKTMLNQDLTPQVMLDVIAKQNEAIEAKIIELITIKNHISLLGNRIEHSMGEAVSIQKEEERVLIAYPYASSNQEEFELNIRNVLIELEERYGLLNFELVFLTKLPLLRENSLAYHQILVRTEEALEGITQEKKILPAGKYVTLNYDDSYVNNIQYYEQLMTYINEKKLDVCNEIFEFAILPRVDSHGLEKTLTQLQIRIRERGCIKIDTTQCN